MHHDTHSLRVWGVCVWREGITCVSLGSRKEEEKLTRQDSQRVWTRERRRHAFRRVGVRETRGRTDAQSTPADAARSFCWVLK